jgi:hypothetical protein
VDAAVTILQEIQPASVRAVCYRLFTLGIIDSMAKSETNKVSSGETTPNAHTALTAHTGGSVDAADAVGAVDETLQRHAPTGADGKPFTFDGRPV